MDYKFLVNKELEKFFEEDNLSIGDIFRIITSEKRTGIKIKNKSRFQEISDKEWYEILENALEYERE